MNFRFAEYKDLKRIVTIYNQAIKAGNATADIQEINTTDRETWFLEHTNNTYPIYILEINNKIIGWGSLSAYRKNRGGLKETAEISYYIDYNYHGRGFGSKLIELIINDCERLQIKNLFALLLDINKKSTLILKRFGFVKWGFMPDVANINGTRCGHLIYGLKVNVNIKKVNF